MKTCNLCKVEKPFDQFHKDATRSKDGYSARCAACKNASRKKLFTKTIQVPIKMTESNENVLDTLLNKLGTFYTISVSRDRKCLLKKCGNPEMRWSARTPEELMSLMELEP